MAGPAEGSNSVGPNVLQVKDHGARVQIAEQLERTLFVEAGAGSGKTTSLVERVKNLILIDGVSISKIVAITFTEKSAKELLERITFELADLEACEEEEISLMRIKRALSEIEGAPIGTIHSFARRVLSGFTFAAGLTPEIEVLDEIEKEIEFETRFEAFLSTLLQTQPDPHGLDPLPWAMVVAHSQGASLSVIKKAARALDAAWPLLSRTTTSSPKPTPRLIPELVAKNSQLLSLTNELMGLLDPDKTAAKRCLKLYKFAQLLSDPLSSSDLFLLLEVLKDAPNLSGRRPRTKVPPNAGEARIAELTGATEEIYGEIIDIKTHYIQHWLSVLSDALVEFTFEGVQDRRTEGRLSYEDLLGMARDLILGPNSRAVLEQLGQQYTHYLIDEFQDTDPLQVELIFALAGMSTPVSEAAQGSIKGGSLFFVGDPKQSIYRFRGADLRQFNSVRSQIEPLGGGLVELTTNFRSRIGIVNFINSIFERLLDGSAQGYSFKALTPYVDDQLEQPSVLMLGPIEAIQSTLIGPIRDQEALAVVAQIDELIKSGTMIRDRFTNELRAINESDIAILSPRRSGFDSIIQELDSSPYQYAIGSIISVYRSPEINDVLDTLSAIDDPGNEIYVLKALRSPLFGLSDKEIYHYIKDLDRRINFELDPPPPSDGDSSVAGALSYLKQKRFALASMNVYEMIESIVSERLCFEIAEFDRKPQQSRSRYRLLLEEARLWGQKAPRGTLSEYLNWARSRQETDKAIEELPPPPDTDQIKLMTIHSSKGLEFPVVFLVGIGQSNSATSHTLGFSDAKKPLLKINSALTVEGFDEWIAMDRESQDAEFRRLLYVACTRARDLLFISTYRKYVKAATSPGGAELITNTINEFSIPVTWVTEKYPVSPKHRSGRAPASTSSRLYDAEADFRLTEQAIAAASESLVLTATGDNWVDSAIVLETPTLSHDFEAGSESVIIGNAVHFALSIFDISLLKDSPKDGPLSDQLIDLVRTAVLEACHKHDAEVHFDRVVGLVLAACDSGVLKRAALKTHWKEMYFCSEISGGGILEGYVDLLFEEEGSLHIVDYKTAEFATDWLIDKRVSDYSSQATTYKEAIERVSNRPVSTVTLLFLTNRGAVSRTLTADSDF